MYEASSLQVAATILLVFAVYALAAWLDIRERERAKRATAAKPVSLFGWQYATMFQTVWAVNHETGRGGVEAQDLEALRLAARHIRHRVGVGEVINPTPKGEALLVLATVQWCDEYAQANGVGA